MTTEKQIETAYNPHTSQAQMQTLWEQEGVNRFKGNSPGKAFSIDTPPPTVSGSLHIGHVYSYTQTDLVARYKRMKGFDVFYPMGFDDNGLPTERFVEKQHKIKAHMLKRSEFIKLCLKETEAVEKLFENLWRTLGLSIDWTKLYSTIDKKSQRVSQYSFIDLYKKGLVYRKEEPSLYCTTCRTSVAQAELDSAEVASTFNNITFTTEDGDKLTIATTRPELLPACVAVFFHPDDIRYKHLAGTFVTTPVFEKKVKILADDTGYVDPAMGTGLVMCCTFGDQGDIAWYKNFKLPLIRVIGLDGKWTEAAGPLAGLTVHDARKKVLELLKETGALVDQKNITHSVNTHERCKQEIEYQVLSQWFVNILDHKEQFLQMAEKINWYPSFMKARYDDWVKNLNWDWCISRQRFFGIPFPVWHCTSCNHIILADEKTLPVDPQETTYPGGACPQCKATTIIPDTDVMDTWNTSSLTPQINMNWPQGTDDNLKVPMSMRPQAHDIIRTWAFDTIVKAAYHHNQIPWENIVISGHVLAGKEKISKSQGNSKMDPVELLKQFSADAIRYWTACGKLGSDTAFSDNQLKIGNRLVTKLWNAFKFIGQHTQHHTPSQTVAPHSTLNQWITNNLSTTYAEYQKAFDLFEYQQALEITEKFFWHDFCDNYLELIKDQLFNPGNYDAQALADTHATLYHCGFGILQLFAPFVPHITENLYQEFYKKHEHTVSLHITQFNTARFSHSFASSATLVNHVLNIVATVRKIKSEKQLSLKTEIANLTITTEHDVIDGLKGLSAVIAGITKAKDVTFVAGNWNIEVVLL